jgi:hypothetical protein
MVSLGDYINAIIISLEGDMENEKSVAYGSIGNRIGY